jgi:hypothetical protein
VGHQAPVGLAAAGQEEGGQPQGLELPAPEQRLPAQPRRGQHRPDPAAQAAVVQDVDPGEQGRGGKEEEVQLRAMQRQGGLKQLHQPVAIGKTAAVEPRPPNKQTALTSSWDANE